MSEGTEPGIGGSRPLIWDAHSCLPLHPNAQIDMLERHRQAGAAFVSVNVGMDMNPLEQVMAVMASFTRQIEAMPDRFLLAGSIGDVAEAHQSQKMAIGFDLEGGVPLGKRPEMIRLFQKLGVRQMHLAYNRNNEYCGGCYDTDMPLTKLGKAVVKEINANGILMDCSHHRPPLKPGYH